MSRSYFAQYGNTVLEKGYCYVCKTYSFILNGEYSCCDRPFRSISTKCKVIVPVRNKRKFPLKIEKESILLEQENKCLYCGTPFGTIVFNLRSNKIKVLTPCWDHVEPYSYSYNNNKLNFVAACSICNGIKSNLIFDDFEGLIRYVNKKRQAKTYYQVL